MSWWFRYQVFFLVTRQEWRRSTCSSSGILNLCSLFCDFCLHLLFRRQRLWKTQRCARRKSLARPQRRCFKGTGEPPHRDTALMRSRRKTLATNGSARCTTHWNSKSDPAFLKVSLSPTSESSKFVIWADLHRFDPVVTQPAAELITVCVCDGPDYPTRWLRTCRCLWRSSPCCILPTRRWAAWNALFNRGAGFITLMLVKVVC